MEDKTFELMEKMYSELIQFKEDTNKRFDILENDNKEIQGDITIIKESLSKTNMTIEHDLVPKTTVLFDGQLQNTQQLDRIESAVDKHENIIIRKVK